MTLQTALTQFARSQTTLDWDEWFALVLAAHKEPNRWHGTWASLAPADRKALIALLRRDAGPLSDHILRSILCDTPTDSDDPVLEWALDDATDATERQLERLNELKKDLKDDVQTASQALDSYITIEELRREVQRLREEAAQDPEIAKRRSLEEAIHRLRTYRETLLSRDWDERQAEHQHLVDETESLRAEKNELENAIRQAREDRSNAEKKFIATQHAWEQEQTHLKELRSQIHDLEYRINQVYVVTDRLTEIVDTLQSTLRCASEELSTMGRNLKKMSSIPSIDEKSWFPFPKR